MSNRRRGANPAQFRQQGTQDSPGTTLAFGYTAYKGGVYIMMAGHAGIDAAMQIVPLQKSYSGIRSILSWRGRNGSQHMHSPRELLVFADSGGVGVYHSPAQ